MSDTVFSSSFQRVGRKGSLPSTMVFLAGLSLGVLLAGCKTAGPSGAAGLENSGRGGTGAPAKGGVKVVCAADRFEFTGTREFVVGAASGPAVRKAFKGYVGKSSEAARARLTLECGPATGAAAAPASSQGSDRVLKCTRRLAVFKYESPRGSRWEPVALGGARGVVARQLVPLFQRINQDAALALGFYLSSPATMNQVCSKAPGQPPRVREFGVAHLLQFLGEPWQRARAADAIADTFPVSRKKLGPALVFDVKYVADEERFLVGRYDASHRYLWVAVWGLSKYSPERRSPAPLPAPLRDAMVLDLRRTFERKELDFCPSGEPEFVLRLRVPTNNYDLFKELDERQFSPTTRKALSGRDHKPANPHAINHAIEELSLEYRKVVADTLGEGGAPFSIERDSHCPGNGAAQESEEGAVSSRFALFSREQETRKDVAVVAKKGELYALRVGRAWYQDDKTMLRSLRASNNWRIKCGSGDLAAPGGDVQVTLSTAGLVRALVPLPGNRGCGSEVYVSFEYDKISVDLSKFVSLSSSARTSASVSPDVPFSDPIGLAYSGVLPFSKRLLLASLHRLIDRDGFPSPWEAGTPVSSGGWMLGAPAFKWLETSLSNTTGVDLKFKSLSGARGETEIAALHSVGHVDPQWYITYTVNFSKIIASPDVRAGLLVVFEDDRCKEWCEKGKENCPVKKFSEEYAKWALTLGGEKKPNNLRGELRGLMGRCGAKGSRNCQQDGCVYFKDLEVRPNKYEVDKRFKITFEDAERQRKGKKLFAVYWVGNAYGSAKPGFSCFFGLSSGGKPVPVKEGSDAAFCKKQFAKEAMRLREAGGGSRRGTR